MGTAPRCCNSYLYALKAKAYPKQYRPKYDQMRGLLGLSKDTYANGTPFKLWPHDLPQAASPPSPRPDLALTRNTSLT